MPARNFSSPSRLGSALRRAALAAALALCVVAAAPAIAADLPDPAVIEVQLNDWQRRADRMNREVDALRLSQGAIERLNAEALKIQADVSALRDQVNDEIAERRSLLDALGPPPAAGQTEAADVAEQRKQLQAAVAEADGWAKRAALILARDEQVLDALSTKRVEMLARELGSTKPLPLNPRNWGRAAGELGYLVALAELSIEVWFGRLLAREEMVANGFAGLVGMTALGFAVGWLFAALARRRLERRGLAWGAGAAPSSHAARLALAAIEAALRALPWALALGLGWRAMPHEDALPNAIVMAMGKGLVEAGMLFLAGQIAVAVVFAPRRPGWRLAALPDPAAWSLTRAFLVFFAVAAIDFGVVRAAVNFENVDAFLGVWGLIATIAMFAAVRNVARVRAAEAVKAWPGYRWFAEAALALAMVAAIAGFTTLAQYVALGVVGTLLVLVGAGAAKRLVREGVPGAFDPAGASGLALQRNFSLAPEALRLAEFWAVMLLEFAIVVGALLGLMLVWGATADDIVVFWTRLIEGVRIGSYTFSLADLVLAILVFVVALVVTRYVQRVLEERVFPATSLDSGVRHSLRSGIGYLGLVIGAGLAVSTLGLSVSNLAFVIGALSVGIGFGLQHIVNNFVSGLILLIERPIRQGDRIVVGGNEGIVMRINVRATEIETLDKSTLLVPNAELLQSQVLNWTLRDPSAQVRIALRLPAPPFDAESGRALLAACARAQREFAPEPTVLLRDFDAAGYAFEVRATLADVSLMDRAASDFRFAVDAAIRARKAAAPSG